jgi:large exoprotein involved in heme utilization and adhesion
MRQGQAAAVGQSSRTVMAVTIYRASSDNIESPLKRHTSSHLVSTMHYENSIHSLYSHDTGVPAAGSVPDCL